MAVNDWQGHKPKMVRYHIRQKMLGRIWGQEEPPCHFSNRHNLAIELQNLNPNQTIEIKHQDLSGLDMSYLDLHKVRFLHCNLQHCNFIGANVTGTSFDQSDLSNAVMTADQLCHIVGTPKNLPRIAITAKRIRCIRSRNLKKRGP